jgi:phosphoenolpyruvate-protein kinase (PTS system EI component)
MVNLIANVKPKAPLSAGSVSVGVIVEVPAKATLVDVAVAAVFPIESWYDSTTV